MPQNAEELVPSEMGPLLYETDGGWFTPVTVALPDAVPPRPSLTFTEHVNALRFETVQVAEEPLPEAHPDQE